MTNKLLNIFDRAILAGSDNEEEYKYKVSINPFFNYIAKDYNNRNEDNMVNGYVEDEKTIRSDVNTSDEDFPDTIDNFIEIFQPTTDKTKRAGFLNNSFNSRIDEGKSRIKTCYYFDPNIMNQEKYFRGTTGTDNISGHHPQAVKIKLESTSELKELGFLRKILTQSTYKGALPFFVKSILEGANLIKTGNVAHQAGSEVFQTQYYIYPTNKNSTNTLPFANFTQLYDNPTNSCCPLSNVLRPSALTEGWSWGSGALLQFLNSSYKAHTFVKDEDIFFEILKLDNNNNIVQKFYTSFLTPDSTSWSFYDTQVKVGKEYKYEIYSWRFMTVVGSGTNNRILRSPEPIFSQVIEITQPSLPVPDVSFETYKDDINKYKVKILLNLNKNSENGKFYKEEFKEFVPMGSNNSLYHETLEQWNNRRNRYDIMNDKNKFIYESQRGRFEIYKMTSQPEKDYSNITVVPVFRESSMGTMLAYLDEIEPFKKYYYVFRAINDYDYPSNPTDIYEIELLEDADEVFLNVKIVDFANLNKDKYKNFKSMMKLLQIIPSSNQISINPKTLFDIAELGGYYEEFILNLDELPTLGLNDEGNIWTTLDENEDIKQYGEKFKIRIVSNDTGKKIDLNVRFLLKKMTNYF